MIVLLRICWCVNKHLYKLKRRSVQCFLQWFWVSYVKLSIALKLDTDIMYVTDEAGDILRISSINKSLEKAKTHNVLIRLSTFFYFLVCDSWLQLQWSVFSYKEGHKLIIIRSLQLLVQSTERSFKTQPTEAKSNMFPELNHNSLSFSNTWWVLTCLNLQVLVFRVHLDLGFCSLLWNISRLFFTCWSLRTLWNSPPETTWCWTCRRGNYNF